MLPQGSTLRARATLALALIAFGSLCVLTYAAPQARAASCSGVVGYPGDAATTVEVANWMATGAIAKKIPGELPVMAGLVESGLRNLNYGDADSVGFFQMRTSIWNKDPYKGYLKNPELQLQWFTDQAAAVRAYYIAKGKGDPAASESTYGVWIADIERPAAQYRGRYQLRINDARALINQTCPDLVGINVLAPTSSLRIKRKQHPARTGAIAFHVRCPQVVCVASATALFRLPGRHKMVRLSSDTAMISAGSRTKVKIPVPRSIRVGIRKRLPGRSLARTRLRISVAGTNGAATVRVRKIAISR